MVKLIYMMMINKLIMLCLNNNNQNNNNKIYKSYHKIINVTNYIIYNLFVMLNIYYINLATLSEEELDKIAEQKYQDMLNPQ